MQRQIVSLFDYTGAWCQPYYEAGYLVRQIDIKLGEHAVDILDLNEEALTAWGKVHGILMAPPCTDFSSSGAQYWPVKDLDGRTARSVVLVKKALWIKDFFQPAWWALENPVGRLAKLVPELGEPWYFQPHWYGDPYTKRTGLWGNFNRNLPRQEVEPIKVCNEGSWLMQLGGKSEKTKELRSATPMGFARAFFVANP